MTPEEQLEIDSLKQKLRQSEQLLKQEEGKRIAVERESYETKRQAKQTEEQAKAIRAETDASLAQAAEDMKIALAVSQGIWSFAHLGRAYLARKVAAGRVVHREQQMCLLMQQMIDSQGGGDNQKFQVALEKAKQVIETIKRDGEATRLQVAEACLSYGLDRFSEVFESLVSDNNTLVKVAP